MSDRSTGQITRKLSAVYRHSLLLWVWIALLVLAAGCQADRLKKMESKVDQIHENLYVPPDAVLLTKASTGGHKSYVHPDCFGIYVEFFYGVNRPLNQVIAEYVSELTHADWEPDPNFQRNITSEDAYLRKGPQTTLVIYAANDPGRSPLATVQPDTARFTTVYVLEFRYFEPSTDDCRV